VHLLAAMDHATRTVLAQQQVGGAPEEVPAFQPLLANLDLAGTVVTADALQTHPAAAEFLVTGKQAHYLFCVKANQPTLLDRCAGLPWHRAPAFSRYETYVRIVVDGPAAPDRRRSSVHRCAAARIEPDES
jgi:hypothetical protein